MTSHRNLLKLSCTTVGDRVKVRHKSKDLVGTVRFVGEIVDKSGIYYGIELEKANGDHGGSYHNISYFKANKKHGIFVRKTAIMKTNSKHNTVPRVTVGSRVHVTKANCAGVIRYIGSPDFKPGQLWFGIQLEEP